MNRNKSRDPKPQVIPVWTLPGAHQVLPYLASVMRTVREYRIEALRFDQRARRLAKRPGRPRRDDLLAHEEAVREARLAEERTEEALRELQNLGIYCLDAVRGEALVPFAHGEQLAWFVFDLFDPEPLRFWRLHTDTLSMRRPIAEVSGATGDAPVVV